jgi:hypothetical protein
LSVKSSEFSSRIPTNLTLGLLCLVNPDGAWSAQSMRPW